MWVFKRSDGCSYLCTGVGDDILILFSEGSRLQRAGLISNPDRPLTFHDVIDMLCACLIIFFS